MFYKDKKVLVTGGSGFVGTHFVEQLLTQGAKVRVPLHERSMIIKDKRIETLQADLTKQEDCMKAVKGADCIIHAAGAVSAAGTTINNPMSAITTNLILTARILEAAVATNIDRILIFSSSTGYPVTDYPVKEDEMWSGPTHPTYFGYGWMRRYLEKISEFVASKSTVKVALVRPTAVYGRWDDFNPASSHVIPALIQRALAKENPFVVWGTGNEVRDFLHISDLVRGCLLMLEKYAICDPVNIGYGKVVTIKDIVDIVLKETGHTGAKVVYDTTKPTTIPIRMVDVSKAKEILGFEPSISLEEGLKDTIQWYTEHRESQ